MLIFRESFANYVQVVRKISASTMSWDTLWRVAFSNHIYVLNGVMVPWKNRRYSVYSLGHNQPVT